jgi:hypothetical protein
MPLPADESSNSLLILEHIQPLVLSMEVCVWVSSPASVRKLRYRKLIRHMKLHNFSGEKTDIEYYCPMS